jgi:hypothetical protein
MVLRDAGDCWSGDCGQNDRTDLSLPDGSGMSSNAAAIECRRSFTLGWSNRDDHALNVYQLQKLGNRGDFVRFVITGDWFFDKGLKVTQRHRLGEKCHNLLIEALQPARELYSQYFQDYLNGFVDDKHAIGDHSGYEQHCFFHIPNAATFQFMARCRIPISGRWLSCPLLTEGSSDSNWGKDHRQKRRYNPGRQMCRRQTQLDN